MSSGRLKALFQPLKVGDITLRNRIVMAPMGMGLVDPNGGVNERLIAYYVARAQGAAGLIDVAVTTVDYPTGCAAPQVLRVDHDRFVPGLARLARAIKTEGASVFLQLLHAGRYARSAHTGVQPVAPSAIASRYTGEMPRELTIAEAEAIIEQFGAAARRAKEAGFDGVELAANSGYLLSQFLSGLTNKRTDRLGGDISGRATFLLETVKTVRQLVGDTWPISLKLSVNEYMPGGNTTADSQVIARLAVAAGISIVHAWAGWHESPVAMLPMSVPRGAFVPLAEAMKEVVNVPVVAAGRINDPVLADSIVAESRADLVAMGRAFLADPHFPIKASRGDLEGIRKCTACCTCFDAGIQSLVNSRGDGAVVCAVNAELGREVENLVQPATIVKKVLVVGGGPAGMEAARVASLRGHHVTLWEAGARLGGNLLVATVPPYKQELGCLLEFLTTQLQRLGVKVELGKLASAQDINGLGFDEIIVATGGQPIKPNMPGIDSLKVTTAIEVLQGRQTGQKVLVVGGGMVGCETAEFLTAKGKMVTIVEMRNSQIAADVGPTTRWVLVARIKESGIAVLTKTTLVGITERGALVEYQGRSDELQVDTIVLAMGMTPERQLLEGLERMGIHPHTVGDCASVGKIMQAVHAGWDVGRNL